MKWITFGLAGLIAATGFAQEAANPFYVKGTAVSTQGDLRSYAGGKAMGYAVEFGYDFHKPQDELIGLSMFAAYQRVNGKYRTDLAPSYLEYDANGNASTVYEPWNTSFGLDTWRFGGDLRFTTPVKGLVPFAGLNLNFHQGYWTSTSPVIGKRGNMPDAKAKFGFRLGVEYFVTNQVGISLEYNATEWRSDAKEYLDPVTQTTVRKSKGYNPVNPSWVGVSVSYRFDKAF